MAIIKCPECKHEISDKAPFCPSCGVAIAGRIIKCPNCGNVYFSDLDECPVCHHKTIKSGTVNIQKTSSTERDVLPHVENERNMTFNNDVTSVGHDKKSIVDSDTPDENINYAGIKEENTSKNNKKIIMIALFVVLVVVASGLYFYHSANVDRENQAYEYAMQSNDKQVLQDYLDKYLDAPEEHRDSIQSHLDLLKQIDINWTNALVSNSRNALQQYIEQNPNSPFKAMALHKIDSIDWVMATTGNSVESMENYIELHPDGEHVDEANMNIKSINSKTVQTDEKQMISSIFNSFFQSINNKDEDALTSVVNPLLSKFLGKQNATRSDVVTFMHKIYKPEIVSMKWQSLGDYNINKRATTDDDCCYDISFTAIESITDNENNETLNKYKISAIVNGDGRISELNMTKIIS